MYDDEKKEIHFIYGCKGCVNKYLEDYCEWVESSQTRYIE